MDVHSECHRGGSVGSEGSRKDLVARITISRSFAHQRRFQQRYRHALGTESLRPQATSRYVISA